MIIREANLEDCGAIAKTQVDSYNNSYSHILPQAYLSNFKYEEQEQDWRNLLLERRNRILYVVESDREDIIGYALGEVNSDEIPPFESELVAIHIRQDHQQQGIGRQLFVFSANGFYVQGYNALFLWVLADNPACSFYEKLGGNRIKEKYWINNQFFGTNIMEIAYGWYDIQSTFLKNTNP